MVRQRGGRNGRLAAIALLALAGAAAIGFGISRGGGTDPGAQGFAVGGFALGAAVAGAASWLGSALARRPGPLDAAERAALQAEVAGARGELDAIHYSVSHDLRSPIGAALNFLTVLEEDHGERMDPDGRAILARIRRSANAALALLDGLAQLSRVGRKPLHLRAVDVEALVHDTFATLRPDGRSLELDVRAPLPPAVADPELLRIAFAELLSNAVKFTAPREKATVTVGGRRAGDAAIEYWVADDGVGFDPRFAGKLFHVFERLHSRDEFPGAGAGLAVVRRIAERHGGRVRAEGAPGGGARFHLRLPEKETLRSSQEEAA